MFLKLYLQKKQRRKDIYFFALGLIFVNAYAGGFVLAAEDATQIELVVMGCNNNSSCESGIGENILNCPLDCTPAAVAPASSGGGGSTFPATSGLFSVDTVSIKPNIESVVLSWTTATPVISTVMWGTTPDYEIGTLSETIFNPSHQVKIENLLPGKGYYYRIDFKDSSGRSVGQITSAFATQPIPALPDKTPPINPKVVSAVASSEKVVLKWDNPKDIDFESIRVTRSTYSYPRDPLEGKIIYEGKGNLVTDADIQEGFEYYYVLFAKDKNGNYSSGAVYYFDNKNKDAGGVLAPTKTFVGSDGSSFGLGLEMGSLSISDFVFMQEGREANSYGNVVVVDVNQPVTISLPYKSLPEILKTIILHVQDPENPTESASFLLRINEEKTKYESTIGAFEYPGKAKFSVEITDFNNKKLYNVEGDFLIQGQSKGVATGDNLIKSLNQAISEASLITKILTIIWIIVMVYIIARAHLLF